jgi:hypothetical protein
MARIRRINVSQVEGNSANDSNDSEIRPYGEIGFYEGEYNQDTDRNSLELLIFDGKRVHLRSKVLAPGVFYGSGDDSGDQTYGFDTIKLIPDAELHYNNGGYGNDQYLIVDPTVPNHIHIRAGGTQDDSGAQLFLGGEISHFSVGAGLNPPLYLKANDNQWTLGTDGAIYLPVKGALHPVDDNAGLVLYDTDNSNRAQLAAIGNINLRTDSTNAGKEWTFDTNGDLTVPNYIYFKDGSFIGDEGGAGTPVFRIDAPIGLGINLTTDSGMEGSNNVWTFGVDGTVTFPDSTVQTTAWTGTTSVSQITNLPSGNGALSVSTVGSAIAVEYTPADVPTNISDLTNDAGYITDTVTGDLTVSGTVTANNFEGNITITGDVVGTSANVELVAGSYTATMDDTGSFSAPVLVSTNSVGDEGGEINLSLPAAANTTLDGTSLVIDSFQDQLRLFENGSNARGVYIDLTKAPNNVGGELLWKVSGIVDAGAFVTLDNLKATVPTTGNRGLSVAAVSGSFFANIGAWYGGSGGTGGDSVNNLEVTTTESGSLFSWNFVAEGNSAQYTIYDKTNSRMYRVTLMIGPAYLNNFISIERLY